MSISKSTTTRREPGASSGALATAPAALAMVAPSQPQVTITHCLPVHQAADNTLLPRGQGLHQGNLPVTMDITTQGTSHGMDPAHRNNPAAAAAGAAAAPLRQARS